MQIDSAFVQIDSAFVQIDSAVLQKRFFGHPNRFGVPENGRIARRKRFGDLACPFSARGRSGDGTPVGFVIGRGSGVRGSQESLAIARHSWAA